MYTFYHYLSFTNTIIIIIIIIIYHYQYHHYFCLVVSFAFLERERERWWSGRERGTPMSPGYCAAVPLLICGAYAGRSHAEFFVCFKSHNSTHSKKTMSISTQMDSISTVGMRRCVC